MTERPFNKDAYNSCDNICKVKLNEMLSNKGYVSKYEINNETFERHDMVFIKDNKEIIFENEMRECFDRIKFNWNSVHIPIRKKNTKANYYIVWNTDCSEIILINTIFFHKSPIVSINCRSRNGMPAYTESMIDISKENVDFYKKNKNIWKLNN